MVFDGQSLNNFPAEVTPFPVRVMAGRRIAFSTVAINGTAFSVLTTTQAARLHTVLKNHERSVLVLTGGTGDVVQGDSAATILTTMQTYAAAARAAGATYIVCSTITPSTAFTGPQETVRVAVNALIRASSSWEAVADLAADSHLTNAADTTYYGDGTHLTDAGAQVAADIVGPLVTTALAAVI